jgi:DNA-binding GntR family transcriptional regulator
MSVLPIRRATSAASIAEALRDELLSGAYPPGTPLGDADVIERTGVSSATARTALSELEHDGLVVHSLHRGVEVVRITQDDVRDIYAARRVFEMSGLEVLLRRRPVDVTWLEAAIERMGEAAVAGDGRALVEADLAFHLAIAELADNRIVLGVLRELGGEACEIGALHGAVPTLRAGRPQTPPVGPATERVGADTEKLGGAAHPVAAHPPDANATLHIGANQLLYPPNTGVSRRRPCRARRGARRPGSHALRLRLAAPGR